MIELGPLPGDDDLVRSLQPLYDAGAAHALEVALADAPERRRRPRPTRKPADELTERIVDALADLAEGATAEELARDLDTEPDLVTAELEELGAIGIVVRSDPGEDARFWLG